MKKNSLKTGFLLLVCIQCSPILHTQNSLNIVKKNGSKESFLLSSTRKLTFSSGNLVLTPIFKNIITFSLTDIKDINFQSGTINDTSEVNATLRISIYPNPTDDELHVVSNETILQIEIFNLQGEKIIQIYPLYANIQLHLNSYKKGIYMIQVMTAGGVSVNKIIKD